MTTVAGAYEAGLPAAARHDAGVYYTPSDVARRLVEVVVPASRFRAVPPTVCDPTCGGGAFLVAAAGHLYRLGHAVDLIVEDLLWGIDVDPDAVAATRQALRDWATAKGVNAEPRHIEVADSLLDEPTGWADGPGFDIVIGNPPFQNQLASGTARDTERAERVRARLGAAAAPYADSAALYLVVACRLAAAGGRVALIVPESVLAARDAGPARAEVLSRASLVGLWWAGEPIFDAGVQVCAPVLELGRRSGVRAVRRWRGRRFAPAGRVPPPGPLREPGSSWSPLLASLRGAPNVSLDPVHDGRTPEGHSTLAAMATATAGFRDQYYGVAPHVHEAELATDRSEVCLVTAGLIDPMRCRWGRSPTRFNRAVWRAPVVDLDGLAAADPTLAAWAAARLVPKVVVATQTRAIEAAVDENGTWWPSVPTVAVQPRSGDPADLWCIAAVLSAPPVTAWALAQFGGTALSSDALKLSATQVLSVPLPADAGAWAVGAEAAAAAQRAADGDDAEGWATALDVLGEAMTRAYGDDDDVFRWWAARRPAWRSAPGGAGRAVPSRR